MGAVRIVSVERGHDPRDFTLVSFGGAGPLHGCALAALLGITRGLVPHASGMLCADGLLAADLKAEFSLTLPKAGAVDLAVAQKIFAELTQQADDWLTAEMVAPEGREQSKVAMLRCHGQGGEVLIHWVDDAAGVEAAFSAAHKGLHGFTLDSAVELVTLRVEATGRMPAPPRPMLAKGSGAKPRDRFPVHFDSGETEVPLYDRTAPGAGDTIAGPAIVAQLDATTVVLPG